MWKLVIEDDEGKRTTVTLSRDEYTIGRKEGNTIRLTERNVSRTHGKIRYEVPVEGAPSANRHPYQIDDLGSANGIFVNSIRVEGTRELSHGDLIQIGDFRIAIQDESIVSAPSFNPADDLRKTIPGRPLNKHIPQLVERPNRLVMLVGPTPGAEYPLDRDRMTLGRAEDAHISINHNSVSRLHCELHALGDGRFEVVDKGSANGVRVNSTELRRGIFEAGDTLELGDVRFKIVGAGQIYRPPPAELVQLDSESGTSNKASLRPPMPGGLPYVGIAVGLVIVAATVWFLNRPKSIHEAPPSASATVIQPVQAREDLLRPLLPVESPPLEKTPDAMAEPEHTPVADTTDRHLNHPEALSGAALPTSASAAPTPSSAHSASKLPPASDMDRVRALMLDGPKDPNAWKAARRILQPKFDSGQATTEEVQALKTVCKAMADQSCINRCKERLNP